MPWKKPGGGDGQGPWGGGGPSGPAPPDIEEMLRRGQAARVSSLFYLTPPTAAVFGYLTYGETFGWFGLAGFAIAVIGVGLASRGGR